MAMDRRPVLWVVLEKLNLKRRGIPVLTLTIHCPLPERTARYFENPVVVWSTDWNLVVGRCVGYDPATQQITVELGHPTIEQAVVLSGVVLDAYPTVEEHSGELMSISLHPVPVQKTY